MIQEEFKLQNLTQNIQFKFDYSIIQTNLTSNLNKIVNYLNNTQKKLISMNQKSDLKYNVLQQKINSMENIFNSIFNKTGKRMSIKAIDQTIQPIQQKTIISSIKKIKDQKFTNKNKGQIQNQQSSKQIPNQFEYLKNQIQKLKRLISSKDSLKTKTESISTDDLAKQQQNKGSNSLKTQQDQDQDEQEYNEIQNNGGALEVSNSNIKKQIERNMKKNQQRLQREFKQEYIKLETKLMQKLQDKEKNILSTINDNKKNNDMYVENITQNTYKISKIEDELNKTVIKLKNLQFKNEQALNDVVLNIQRQNYQTSNKTLQLIKNLQNRLDSLKNSYKQSNITLLDQFNHQTQYSVDQKQNKALNQTAPNLRRTSVNVNVQSRIQVLQHHLKGLNNQFKQFKQDQQNKKRQSKIINLGSTNQLSSSKGFLPKLQQNKIKIIENKPEFQIEFLNNEIKKMHERINNFTETVENQKKKLKKIEQKELEIPNRLFEIETKIREQSEINEIQLLQLIKQMINRCLTDPFNNHFTNALKKQIHIKFLEIKHQYYGILKQIEKKVEDRVDQKLFDHIKQEFQTNFIQIKSIISRKCQSEDLKKSNKFLENKLRELYNHLKITEANQQQQVRQHSLSILKRKA